VAELEGEVVAGALCFYARRHAVYWHGAALKRARAARPMNLLIDNLLIDEVLRDACARDELRWFDFNPSGPLAGVRAFKQHFGARSIACPTVRRESLMVRVAHGSKRCAERVLRRSR